MLISMIVYRTGQKHIDLLNCLLQHVPSIFNDATLKITIIMDEFIARTS